MQEHPVCWLPTITRQYRHITWTHDSRLFLMGFPASQRQMHTDVTSHECSGDEVPDAWYQASHQQNQGLYTQICF